MRSYYLYADKKTKTLTELKVSVLPLGFSPVPGSITVTFAGQNYVDWFIQGTSLHFVHRDPREWQTLYQNRAGNEVHKSWMNAGYLGQPEDVVSVAYSYLEWNTTDQDFDVNTITENLTIAEDESEVYYQLFQVMPSSNLNVGVSSNYTSSKLRQPFPPRYGPVVITDDTVEYSDKRGHSNEFSIDSLTGDLLFHPSENIVINPAFEVVETSSNALQWTKRDLSGTVVAAGTVSSTNVTDIKAVYGKRFMVLGSKETVHQTVKVRSVKPHHISFYAQAPGSDSYVGLVVNPIDLNDVYRDENETNRGTPYDAAVGVLSTLVSVSSNVWSRYEAVVGEDDTYFSGEGTLLGNLPSSTRKLELRLVGPSNNSAYIDAVQIHEGSEKAPFLGILPKSTIEYEGDPDGVYQPDPSTTGHWLNDVNLNPITSPKPDGFLSLYDLNDVDDWQLGKGGSDISLSTTTNTYVFGRVHTPYSRTSGIGKLVERQTFHKSGWPVDDEVYPLPTSNIQVRPSQAEEIPPPNSYIDTSGFVHFYTEPSSNKSQKTVLAPIFYDQYNNPIPSTNMIITQKGSTDFVTHRGITDVAGRARFVHQSLAGSPRVRSAETITFTPDTSYLGSQVQAIYLADIV